jgi:hypothetical protein
MPYDDLIAALQEYQEYEVDFDSKKYQVEVEVLEITGKYLYVGVAVDDGSSRPPSVR